jgi:hypothetical protein
MYPALQRPRHTSAKTAENVFPHAGDTTITALALCTQSIPPASKRLGLLPPFAMWTAFSSSDYCEGSVPHHVLPRSPRIACFRGGHDVVPMFPFSTLWMVRCLLYPWRPRRETRRSKSIPDTGLFVPPRRDGKAHPDHAALPCRAITLQRQVFHQVRGFYHRFVVSPYIPR